MSERDYQGLESSFDREAGVLTVTVDRRIIQSSSNLAKLLDLLRERIEDPLTERIEIVPRRA